MWLTGPCVHYWYWYSFSFRGLEIYDSYELNGMNGMRQLQLSVQLYGAERTIAVVYCYGLLIKLK